MWELTTGCKSFANLEHDVNLINEILDENILKLLMILMICFANLMKKYLDPDPSEKL